MTNDESLNLGQDALFCHDQSLLRASARTSTAYKGNCTQLRVSARSAISVVVTDYTFINMERLKLDMAAAAAATSDRQFSLAATGGRNPDFYRNFVRGNRDKRLSADVYAGIVRALGKSADEYISGAPVQLKQANAAVLTSTFAMLLDSLGIDPLEGGRAQKLAAQFPDALKRIEALQTQMAEDLTHIPNEHAQASDKDHSPA